MPILDPNDWEGIKKGLFSKAELEEIQKIKATPDRKIAIKWGQHRKLYGNRDAFPEDADTGPIVAMFDGSPEPYRIYKK